ncbi:hypothetical protein AVEN_40374-1 [Araneus ventricosus]|uniref:Uncharacterized protein n=1 Tax=Araneus ventricosus TaxID=182803 RepID=A0A4Y2IPQ6_ARAVE|nr:hypothetical protein AVEN_40374-1 [Araneus ventricosus]
MYNLACNRPNTRRIFSGTGFRTCNPPARHLTTRPPRRQYADEKLPYKILKYAAPDAIYLRYATDDCSSYKLERKQQNSIIYQNRIVRNLDEWCDFEVYPDYEKGYRVTTFF